MAAVLSSKFSEAVFKNALISTGDALLVKISCRREDGWSSGPNGGGSNIRGLALMMLRTELSTN